MTALARGAASERRTTHRRPGGLRTMSIVGRHELRMMRRNMEAHVALLVMPPIVVGVATPLLSPLVREEGLGTTGAVITVPGFLVTFGLVAVGFVAGSVFSEHGWGTWTRLRTVGAPPWSLITGKIGPHGLLLFGQVAVLAVLARVAFGLPSLSAPLALGVLTTAWTLCLVGMAALLVCFARDMEQTYLFSNMGSLVLSGLGGVLVPYEMLPGPLQAFAHVLPTYWAVRGYRDVFLGHGLGTVGLPVVVLTGMAVLFLAIAARRFRFDDVKGG